MYKDLHTLKRGFTLIELIISMALVTIILSVLLFSFKFYYDTYYTLYDDTSSSNNLRFLSAILEKQIRNTPILYIINGRIYLKDIESSEYFDTYMLSDHMVYKIKTDKNFDSIGLGSTSQIAWNIDGFFLTLTDKGNINMAISTIYEGKTMIVDKEVKVMGKVIVIEH